MGFTGSTEAMLRLAVQCSVPYSIPCALERGGSLWDKNALQGVCRDKSVTYVVNFDSKMHTERCEERR